MTTRKAAKWIEDLITIIGMGVWVDDLPFEPHRTLIRSIQVKAPDRGEKSLGYRIWIEGEGRIFLDFNACISHIRIVDAFGRLRRVFKGEGTDIVPLYNINSKRLEVAFPTDIMVGDMFMENGTIPRPISLVEEVEFEKGTSQYERLLKVGFVSDELEIEYFNFLYEGFTQTDNSVYVLLK